MMRLRACVLGVALALMALSVPVQAVGTATVTASDAGHGVTKYSIAWTSTAGGAVSANLFAVTTGHLLAVKFMPNLAGTQPTDLYDVTLVDTDAIDLLSGVGANLSNAAGKIVSWDPPLFRDSTQNLDLIVANAGNAKTGIVSVWVGP